MRRIILSLILLILILVASPCYAASLSLDCTDGESLTSFVGEVRSRSIAGDTLIIADRDICAREMIAVKTETDAEGNEIVIRPAILGCFQFKGDDVSIFIGERIITGKTSMQGNQLTITNITDTGVRE